MSQAEYQAILARQKPHRPFSCGREGETPAGGEKQLHEAILAECRRRKWIPGHGSMAHATRRIEGEPDFIILADGGRLLLVECKARTGKLSPAQQGYHHWAGSLGHKVHVIRSFSEFVKLCKTICKTPQNETEQAKGCDPQDSRAIEGMGAALVGRPDRDRSEAEPETVSEHAAS